MYNILLHSVLDLTIVIILLFTDFCHAIQLHNQCAVLQIYNNIMNRAIFYNNLQGRALARESRTNPRNGVCLMP